MSVSDFRYVETKEFGCVVDKVEEQDPLHDMKILNTIWIFGTG